MLPLYGMHINQCSGLIGGVLIPKITGIHIRGFFCDDESIRYDYKEDTVTPVALFLYVFFVMILTVRSVNEV